MDAVKKYLRVILNILIPLVSIVLVLYLGPKLLRFFLPFVIGWILALIANPLVRLLERRVKLVRKHSSILIVIGVLGGLIALIYLVVSRLAIEGAAFARDLPALIEGMTEEIRLAMSRFEGLFLRLPEGLRTSIYQITENMDEYVGMVIQRLTPTTACALLDSAALITRGTAPAAASSAPTPWETVLAISSPRVWGRAAVVFAIRAPFRVFETPLSNI